MSSSRNVRKIFIQRDYSRGTGVRFSTEFPRELTGKVSQLIGTSGVSQSVKMCKRKDDVPFSRRRAGTQLGTGGRVINKCHVTMTQYTHTVVLSMHILGIGAWYGTLNLLCLARNHNNVSGPTYLNDNLCVHVFNQFGIQQGLLA